MTNPELIEHRREMFDFGGGAANDDGGVGKGRKFEAELGQSNIGATEKDAVDGRLHTGDDLGNLCPGQPANRDFDESAVGRWNRGDRVAQVVAAVGAKRDALVGRVSMKVRNGFASFAGIEGELECRLVCLSDIVECQYDFTHGKPTLHEWL